MQTLSWMAWTWQTAAFFIFIALSLVTMTTLELRSPGGAPRRGIFGLDTTRGDRLFITLLGAAFIHLVWLGCFGGRPSRSWLLLLAEAVEPQTWSLGTDALEAWLRDLKAPLWWGTIVSLVWGVFVFRWV